MAYPQEAAGFVSLVSSYYSSVYFCACGGAIHIFFAWRIVFVRTEEECEDRSHDTKIGEVGLQLRQMCILHVDSLGWLRKFEGRRALPVKLYEAQLILGCRWEADDFRSSEVADRESTARVEGVESGEGLLLQGFAGPRA